MHDHSNAPRGRDTLSRPIPPPEHAHLVLASLRVIGGPLYCPEGPEYVLPCTYGEESRVVIGRGAEGNQWQLLNDAAISRHHVIVERAGLGRVQLVRHPEAVKGQLLIDNVSEMRKELGPGEQFLIGDTLIAVFNAAMRMARGTLRFLLGGEADHAGVVDRMLCQVTRGAPVALLGSSNLWPRAVARYLHEKVSLRGAGPLQEIVEPPMCDEDHDDVIRRAHAGGSLLVLGDDPTARERKAIGRLVETMTARKLPIYVVARDRAIAMATLDAQWNSFHELQLTPVQRRGETPLALLSDMATWLRLRARPGVFGPNLMPLEGYGWPNELDEVAEVTRALLAVDKPLSLNKAADSVGRSRPTFKRWHKRMGFVKTADPDGIPLDVDSEGDDDPEDE